MHVDEAKATCGIFAGEKRGLGVSDHSDVSEILIVRSRMNEGSRGIVGWKASGLFGGKFWFGGHERAP
jgi:hypothetical protein